MIAHTLTTPTRRASEAAAYSLARASGWCAAMLATLTTGCSTAPSTTAEEKAALLALQTDYGLRHYETDDQGRVIGLKLEGDEFDDDALDYVRNFPMLQELSLKNSSVTDAGLKKLQDLERLQKLNLLGTSITDRGLAHLEDVPSLQYLWVAKSAGLTGKGIQFLESAVTGIQVFGGKRRPQLR